MTINNKLLADSVNDAAVCANDELEHCSHSNYGTCGAAMLSKIGPAGNCLASCESVPTMIKEMCQCWWLVVCVVWDLDFINDMLLVDLDFTGELVFMDFGFTDELVFVDLGFMSWL